MTWRNIRKPMTASSFHKIITPQGKLSKQWREYACVLIAERILQRKIEF